MSAERYAIRVFVSSTSEDLKPFRAVARDFILKIGWIPIMMEDFGAMPEATVRACHDQLATCQLLLLIQAFRRGWVPSTEQGGDGTESITALELDYAKSPHHPVPVLAMLASETWPGNQWEKDDEGRRWVDRFRASLNLPAEFFDYEDPSGAEEHRLPSFRTKVHAVLVAHKERLQQASPGKQGGGGIDFFDSARDAMVSGRSVPFIGAEIYGDESLSASALIKAMSDVELDPARSLATVAEYCERFLGDRGRFLDQLRDLINARSGRTRLPSVMEMLSQVKMDTPALVIAATYDQMLEQHLRAERRKFAVVAHIVHSFENENDGKIMVFRDGAQPVICLADKVELASDELVVYRPLGSPLLHEHLNPELGIDTVVITETDHLGFLGWLQNQHTKIPTAFSRKLQTRPLVFLGYGLDVWQYRLVMQVFQAVGARRAPIIAVRKPASIMEELAWKRLGADLARCDPNDFADRILQQLQPA